MPVLAVQRDLEGQPDCLPFVDRCDVQACCCNPSRLIELPEWAGDVNAGRLTIDEVGYFHAVSLGCFNAFLLALYSSLMRS